MYIGNFNAIKLNIVLKFDYFFVLNLFSRKFTAWYLKKLFV